MIAFGLIPPLCLLATAHSEIKLSPFPIIREVSVMTKTERQTEREGESERDREIETGCEGEREENRERGR